MLLKLKMTIGKTTQDKNNYKNKLANELQKSLDNVKEIKRNRQDKKKLKLMSIKQNKISEMRDEETNMLHNKLTKGGILVTNHHVKKNIEKELIHILDNLKKKLEIEQIKKKVIKEIIYKINKYFIYIKFIIYFITKNEKNFYLFGNSGLGPIPFLSNINSPKYN